MDYDAYGNPIKPKSSGALLPLFIVLLASVGGNYWLWKERAKSSAEANAATAKLAAADAMQKEMTERLATLEAERQSLVEAKEQALKDAAARATELAKLKDDVAGVEVEKEPDADAADKTKADVKTKDASDKGADKKADAKAKAKSKAKKKAAAESSRKKEKDAGGSAKPPADREL
jgi:colicin import membrane protein